MAVAIQLPLTSELPATVGNRLSNGSISRKQRQSYAPATLPAVDRDQMQSEYALE